MQVEGQANVYAAGYGYNAATGQQQTEPPSGEVEAAPQPYVQAEGLPYTPPASATTVETSPPVADPIPTAPAQTPPPSPSEQTPQSQTYTGCMAMPPAASTLPITGEPAPAPPPTATAGEIATEQALGGGSASKLVAQLASMRRKDDKAGLEAFAIAFAKNYGISAEDARLLTEAMSRGLADSKAIAEGINAMRNMSASDRTGWLSAWLPVAREAAKAINYIDGNKDVRMFGATPQTANAIGELAAMNVRLIDRDKKLPAGQSLTTRAEAAKQAAIARVSRDAGANGLMAEASKAATDPDANNYLASVLINLFKVPAALADKLIASMRSRSQVGKMVAEAIQILENIGPQSGFAQGFFHAAEQALAAEAAIAADPFKAALGPMGNKDVKAIATLADYVDTLKKYALSLTKQKVDAAKAA